MPTGCQAALAATGVLSPRFDSCLRKEPFPSLGSRLEVLRAAARAGSLAEENSLPASGFLPAFRRTLTGIVVLRWGGARQLWPHHARQIVPRRVTWFPPAHGLLLPAFVLCVDGAYL
jgi:hypothetical protein